MVPLLNLVLSISALNDLIQVVDSAPASLKFFDQHIDHFSSTTESRTTYKQRYFEDATHFQGPGHPILVVVGGEGGMSVYTGIYYPWVQNTLAKRFKALVIQPEHRFYGQSQPVDKNDEKWMSLLTPMQSLADLATLVREVQKEKGCSKSIRNSESDSDHDVTDSSDYCPVIVIGGSYPGWLSAMARLRYPQVFDGSYSASAPLRFYGQNVEGGAYYKIISDSAEKAVSGCKDAAKRAFYDFSAKVYEGPAVISAITAAADSIGICPSLPEYLSYDRDVFFNEIVMVFMFTFANLNMANYPPGSTTGLARACKKLVEADKTGHSDLRLNALKEILADNSMMMTKTSRGSVERMRLGSGIDDYTISSEKSLNNIVSKSESDTESDLDDDNIVISESKNLNFMKKLSSLSLNDKRYNTKCTDLHPFLPAGANSTLSCGDWSGCGSGSDGQSWDFQTSTLLVERIGTEGGENDMFPPRKWKLDWLRRHAKSRFYPACSSPWDLSKSCTQPRELADLWGFGSVKEIVKLGTSNIIFTNGLMDGWSAGGFHNISHDLSHDIIDDHVTDDKFQFQSLSESQELYTINFPNGAHHSDLSHFADDPSFDTPDITEGRAKAADIFEKWIRNIKINLKKEKFSGSAKQDLKLESLEMLSI